MSTLVIEYCHLEGGKLTAPPFAEETLLMQMTGWDWPSLMATPARIVEETALIHRVRGEYQAQKGRDGSAEA